MHGLIDMRGVLLALCLCALAPSPGRAQRWVEALTRLEVAPVKLEDPSAPLHERIALAEALGRFGPAQESVAALEAALASELPPALLDSVLRSLGRRGQARSVPVLAALLARERPVAAAAFALSSIGDRQARAALQAASKHERAGPFARAALARLVPGAEREPARATRKPGASTRALFAQLGTQRGSAAAAELASAREQAAIEPLARCSRAGVQARACSRALALLVRRLGPELTASAHATAFRALRALPKGSRAQLLRALARDGSVAAQLEEALTAQSPLERAHAALAAQALDARVLAPAIERALGAETDPFATRALLRAALALEIEPKIALLERALGNDAIAAEALDAIAAAGRPLPERLRIELRRALDPERDSRTRAAAAHALAATEGARSYAALAAHAEDSVPHVRRAVVHALSNLCGSEPRGERACESLSVLARTEPSGELRALAKAASSRAEPGRPATRDTLDVQVGEAAREGLIPIDIELPDGRILRVLPLASGELLVPDLPAGSVQVRAAPPSPTTHAESIGRTRGS